jgi:hypothetical protein
MLVFKNTEYKKLHGMKDIKKRGRAFTCCTDDQRLRQFVRNVYEGQRQGRYNGSGTDDSDCFSMSDHYSAYE